MNGGECEPYWERRLGRDDLAAVAGVRAGLRRFLVHWGAPGRAETAELLTSELVTNALVHTDGGAVVTAVLGGGPSAVVKGLLRVEVRDTLPRRPVLRASDVGPPARESGSGTDDDRCSGDGDRWAGESVATSGRGLLLVQALADAWGVRTHGTGKAVWFELAAEGR
ncbi:ATP-binding protein [Streptomyces mobaraensis]|uniref:ATP-binding protein n=1 Tax=Streptomyces mobaraensis (strain ATCC 29032 / DSM 40847 / JCM 4168 / NBRC 13819 / NCIMB 11159 / IPCR 16-22) TaxID=1223523 RepID=M2ZYQ0_STRM1|nr:ATP-binding protein [Streptomyces mobaraensis]EME97898.1 ATP-binding protein [Streptomyces mobaraensis NBRC 13819 = DSM 40847]